MAKEFSSPPARTRPPGQVSSFSVAWEWSMDIITWAVNKNSLHGVLLLGGSSQVEGVVSNYCDRKSPRTGVVLLPKWPYYLGWSSKYTRRKQSKWYPKWWAEKNMSNTRHHSGIILGICWISGGLPWRCVEHQFSSPKNQRLGGVNEPVLFLKI